MCGGSSPRPAPTPAPAPPPPSDSPVAPVVNAQQASDNQAVYANRSGVGSLRIDLAQSIPSASSGLAIPV